MRFLFLIYSLSLWSIEPKKVETYVVSKTAFTQPIQLVGTLKAHREAVLTAGTSGILTHIFVREGVKVKKGKLLARLDDDSNKRKSLADSKITLENKKKRLARVKKLYQQGDLSLKDLEEAQNDLASAQNSTHQIEHELSNTEFTAPFDGQCGLFRAEIGSYISAGSPVVAVYDVSSFGVYFSVPESLLSELKIGQKIKVKDYEATLTSFENRLNPKNYLAYAKAKLDKCPNCTIGSKVPVQLSLQGDKKMLAVPSEAVFLKNAQSYVYKVVDKKAILTPVKTGERAKKQIAILEGLTVGDVIILRGQSRISNDDPVY
jgi:membrane fusion protein (multidrug efflux system)